MWKNTSPDSPALAGNIQPYIDIIFVTGEEAEEIYQAVLSVVEWQDLLLIICVGWVMEPVIWYIYDTLSRKECFRDTWAFQIVHHVAQLARLAILVYIVDVVDVILPIMGFEYAKQRRFSRLFAKVMYTIWLAFRFRAYKRFFLTRFIAERRKNQGLATMLNRLMNGAIFVLTTSFLIDVLDVEMGFTLKSFFAFGSVGTLAFTLASQDLAANLVNGFFLSISTNVYQGDLVKFGDGTSGVVRRMGWIQTVIRGPEDHVITVPNSYLASQRVHNLSRDKMCQVYQELRFHYKDADKLEACMEDMKEEIKASCPEVITDGTRQFRVVWTGYMEDHIQVMVDVHFLLPAIGDEYWNNRQNVMKAINRAVKKHGLEFAFRKYALAKVD